MSSDRHLKDGEERRHWHLTCQFCGRLFCAKNGAKFGSNACRQKAYRTRTLSSLHISTSTNVTKPGFSDENTTIYDWSQRRTVPLAKAKKGGRS